MDHHHLQQLHQQQLLQAQHQHQHHHHHHHQQQQHFQPPQQPHYHYNTNTHQSYYPPQYQYPQQQQLQQNGYHPSNYTNLYPQQAYPQSAVPRPPELPVPPAVAVLSRLVQYSGAVGSQWNTPPMVGQPFKPMHNRSVSEPDFGRTQGKASGGTSRFSHFGFGSQLLQKTVGLVLRPRPGKQAKLGETNKFYYDEKLKRWVEEGAEPPAEEPALRPPPTTAVFQNGVSDYN